MNLSPTNRRARVAARGSSLRVEIVSNRRDLRAFLEFPYRLYRNEAAWVPPLRMEMKERLDPKRHPFFHHGRVRLLLARRGGRVVGRAAAFVDERYNTFHGERSGAFGFLDFERDGETAAALVRAAASFAREAGMVMLRGPFGWSTNEECGTLVEGCDRPPAVQMPWHPVWHGPLLEGTGLRKARDLLAYHVERNEAVDRLGERMARIMERGGLAVRTVDLSRFVDEIAVIREIYNEAWRDNWGFVPMDEEEFAWQARMLKPVVVPDLALVVEAKGKPAGFIIALPDYNQVLKSMNGRLFPLGIVKFLLHRRRIDALRVVAMGVRPAFRRKGAEGAMIHRICVRGTEMGYRGAELSWVLEDNLPMRKAAENLGARITKRYRIYEAPVEELLV